MSHLQTLISDWLQKTSQCAEKLHQSSFRDLFKDILHGAPYHLRYHVNEQFPELFLVYSTDFSDSTNPVVKECNGIVLDAYTFRIVAYGCDGILRLHSRDMDCIDWPSVDSIYETEDGTMLKFFFALGQWILSTNRRLDAYQTAWHTATPYGILFDHALYMAGHSRAEFEALLEPAFTYTFVLLHPENYHIVPHTQPPRLVFVSRRETFNGSFVESIEPGFDVGTFLTTKKVVSPAEAVESLRHSQDTEDARDNNDALLPLQCDAKRGLVFLRRTGTSLDRVKIDYPWFEEAVQLRKNCALLHESYLAGNASERARMKRVFFHAISTFQWIDHALVQLKKELLRRYRAVFITKKEVLDRNDPLYFVLRAIHREYLRTRIVMRADTVEKVLETQCRLYPRKLGAILITSRQDRHL